MPAARQPVTVAPNLDTEPAAPPAALACPAGHGGHQPGASFCAQCGAQLRAPAPAGPRPDGFLTALAGVRSARQHSAADVDAALPSNASQQVTVTRPGSEPYDHDPMHDDRVINLIMAGASNAEVQKMMGKVMREYREAAKNGHGPGQQVTGPRRGTAWMTPSELARSEAAELSRAIDMPNDSHLPRGTAVTVTPIPRGDQDYGQDQASAWGAGSRCTGGHPLSPEDSACGICGSAAIFNEDPEAPIPPPSYPHYPATPGLVGR